MRLVGETLVKGHGHFLRALLADELLPKAPHLIVELVLVSAALWDSRST